MIVTWYWPDCDFHNGDWKEAKQDSFFVECETLEESERMPITGKAIGRRNLHISKGRYCYLVARDLSSVVESAPHYPYHQMWNAYSPFLPLDPPLKLGSLQELANLNVAAIEAERMEAEREKSRRRKGIFRRLFGGGK